MLLSVVMPSFNQREFIEHAVQSIVQQASANPQCQAEGWQLVVADGGSTDGTLQYLLMLSQQHPNITVLHGPDAGPADALNKALHYAQGRIIGWLNSDDVYADGCINAVLDAFAQHPQWLMLYGEGQHVDSQGQPIAPYPTLPPDVLIDRFQQGCFICQPTAFFTKTLWQQLGAFNVQLRTAFDFDYWLRAFTQHQQYIGFVPQVLAHSRLHPNTITAKQRLTVALEAMQLLHQHLGYVGVNWAKNYVFEMRKEAPGWPNHEPDQSTTQCDCALLLQVASQILNADDLAELNALLGYGQFEQNSTQLLLTQADLPPIAHLIYQCRVDLQAKFDLQTDTGLFEYLTWLLRSANDMNRCLQDDPEFIALCGRPVFAHSALNVLQLVLYLSAKELQSQFALPADEAAYQQWFANTFKRTGQGGLAKVCKVLLGVLPWPASYAQRHHDALHSGQVYKPFGVNVVGYAYGQLGIGEDARMTARALEKLDVPFCLVNFKPGSSIPQNDFTLHHHVRDFGPYSINLFCMTATETVRHFCFEGTKQWEGCYNIGYWPWELNKWPKNWVAACDLMDEIWVSSQFIFDALQPVCPKPVRIVPLHVELGPISPLTRADFGLNPTAKLFCFAFDLHSSVHRKNPHDCIKAFLQSFPKEDPAHHENAVGLVIKTHRPDRYNANWEALKALAAEDSRITIVEHTLSRPDLLALYRCCDAFLSLHRAEGFGRGIAEAILLGLEVVTTGYSGNVDFCKPPQCTLVGYELVDVGLGEYIEGEGMQWAGHLQLPQLTLDIKKDW